MGGLLGGLLSLFEPLGSLVLMFLIGDKERQTKKGTRLVFGGIFAGIVIGGLCGLFLPLGRPELGMIGSILGGAFLGAFVLPFVVTALEMLRENLDR
jgi:hypothetical protein